MRKLAVVLLLIGSAVSVSAQSTWRTYAGGYSTSWKTVGPHGHDQPSCGVYKLTGLLMVAPNGPSWPTYQEDCDGSDFARGNLDNSIGFRFGRERDWFSRGPLRIAGGYESTLSDTEYNLSQRDLSIMAGALQGGVDLERWGARLGVRYGVGSFLTSDIHYGVYSFKEIGLTLPLGSGSAVRITRGTAVHSHAFNQKFRLAGFSEIGDNSTAKEFGLMLVTRPGGGGVSHWNFATISGVSMPRDLNLSRAGYYRLAVFRDLGKSPLQLQLTWTSAAHESKIEGVFNGYPRNLRSKTIDSYGLALRAHRNIWRGLSVHATLGGELAEWTDPHGLLIRGTAPNLHVIEGGVEYAGTAGASVRWMFGRGLGLEAMTEYAYWPTIGLEERRTGVGLVISR